MIRYTLLLAILILIIYRIYRYQVAPSKWEKPLVVTTSTRNNNVIIFSAYDEKFSKKEYVQKNYNILKKYSETHGHRYEQIIDKNNDISPYWLRVKKLNEFLESGKDGDIVVYFDADAIPIHQDVSVNTFVDSLNSESDIFISEDPDLEWNPLYPGILNTGVFIVKNTQRSREFVKLWLSMYNPVKWKKGDDGWICRDKGIPCLYSGENYEQGSFTKLYSSINKNLIKNLNSSTLACDTKSQNCFAMHLMGANDDSRLKIFNEILEPKKVIYSGLSM